jgi:hypothetical protein
MGKDFRRVATASTRVLFLYELLTMSKLMSYSNSSFSFDFPSMSATAPRKLLLLN